MLPELHTSLNFRATWRTTFLKNGGRLETAQSIAGRADSRTTKGYDRRATNLEMSETIRIRYGADFSHLLFKALYYFVTRRWTNRYTANWLWNPEFGIATCSTPWLHDVYAEISPASLLV